MAQGKSGKATLPEYGKGDFRKTAMVLAAMQRLQSPEKGVSLMSLVDATGLDKKTIFVAIRTATVQAGVHVAQDGALYRITNWGPLISPEGATLALKGRLVGRFTQDGVVIDDPLPPRRVNDERKV
ncbi:hypothetical protein [Burkholderia cenocepacia]|uniref:hypothetical protein n=1 Tax=Burkholderia cenocepacia TaxID=95486 RepID=UPI0013DF742F|nr:hypothetical protein [Burkholderia cenocepacia]MCW3587377.1 hypothetical protein [Burkholderia cenocepacia]MCW3632581.1 hypothetical protein [Burkholderia cenocepacia]MCW5181812.1 hypothetical protein [Burkholderia cenocepacia]NGO98059.1 hypothetical protein [Burkholderia cenocepacia]